MEELPPEIIGVQEDTQRARFKALAPFGACLYGSLILFWPFADMIGVKNNWSSLLFFLPVIAVSALSRWLPKAHTGTGVSPRIVLACNLAMAALTTFFGPCAYACGLLSVWLPGRSRARRLRPYRYCPALYARAHWARMCRSDSFLAEWQSAVFPRPSTCLLLSGALHRVGHPGTFFSATAMRVSVI